MNGRKKDKVYRTEKEILIEDREMTTTEEEQEAFRKSESRKSNKRGSNDHKYDKSRKRLI